MRLSSPSLESRNGARLAGKCGTWLARLRSDDIVALAKSAWIQGLSVGINAGQSILLPMMVGPASFGLFAGLYTNIMVSVGISRGPIEVMIQRGHEHRSHIIYQRRSFHRIFLAGLLLAVLMFLGLSAIQGWDVPLGLYLFFSFAVLVGAASGLRRGMLISASRTSELELLDMVIRPGLFLAGAGCCWLLGEVEPLLFWLLGASFVFTLARANLRAARAFAAIPDGQEPAFRPWSALLASNGLSILVKNADVIILGMFLDAPTVGRYFIVARIADLAAFGYSFAAARFVHLFANARRNHRLDEMHRLIDRATAFGMGIAGVAAIAVLTLAPFLLPLIDPILSGYVPALAILLLGQAINATFGVRGAFLTAIEPRYTLGSKLLLNPAAIAAMALAVPRFGPTGAAAVTTLFIFVMQLTNTLLLRRVLAKESASASAVGGGAS